MMRKLGMNKLRIEWGIRAERYEEKVQKYEGDGWIKICLKEIEEEGWKDRYGNERTRYYNRNGLGIVAIEMIKEADYNLENVIIEREK